MLVLKMIPQFQDVCANFAASYQSLHGLATAAQLNAAVHAQLLHPYFQYLAHCSFH